MFSLSLLFLAPLSFCSHLHHLCIVCTSLCLLMCANLGRYMRKGDNSWVDNSNPHVHQEQIPGNHSAIQVVATPRYFSFCVCVSMSVKVPVLFVALFSSPLIIFSIGLHPTTQLVFQSLGMLIKAILCAVAVFRRLFITGTFGFCATGDACTCRQPTSEPCPFFFRTFSGAALN